MDWRSEFTKWWCNEFKAVKFPTAGHVFNYYIDPETKRFLPWTDKVQKFDLDTEIPLQVAPLNLIYYFSSSFNNLSLQALLLKVV